MKTILKLIDLINDEQELRNIIDIQQGNKDFNDLHPNSKIIVAKAKNKILSISEKLTCPNCLDDRFTGYNGRMYNKCDKCGHEWIVTTNHCIH